MAQDSSLSLQIAHIALLKADTGLAALVGTRIYSYIPRNTAYPYVEYFIQEANAWDDSSGDGEEHAITIRVHSELEGPKEAYQILRVVHELIQDNTTPVLTDHLLVNCRRTSKDMFREDQVYTGIGLYRAVTQET